VVAVVVYAGEPGRVAAASIGRTVLEAWIDMIPRPLTNKR